MRLSWGRDCNSPPSGTSFQTFHRGAIPWLRYHWDSLARCFVALRDGHPTYTLNVIRTPFTFTLWLPLRRRSWLLTGVVYSCATTCCDPGRYCWFGHFRPCLCPTGHFPPEIMMETDSLLCMFTSVLDRVSQCCAASHFYSAWPATINNPNYLLEPLDMAINYFSRFWRSILLYRACCTCAVFPWYQRL